MLILTRRQGEVIKIGDDIEIFVLNIKGQQARIGIHAPANIAIHRGEVYERIQAKKNGNR